MKRPPLNKLTVFLFLLLFNFGFAQTYTANYENGITLTKALEKAAEFENLLRTKDYYVTRLNVDSPQEYSVRYKTIDTDGSIFNFQMRYYFYESNFELVMIGMSYTVDDIPTFIESTDTDPLHQEMFAQNKKLFVDLFIDHINRP